MSGERAEGALPSRLRWYVGVPLGTNPLILLDLSILLTVGWSVSWLSLLALQAGFGGYVDYLFRQADPDTGKERMSSFSVKEKQWHAILLSP